MDAPETLFEMPPAAATPRQPRRRVIRVCLAEEPAPYLAQEPMNSPLQVSEYLRAAGMANLPQEEMRVLLLTSRTHLIRDELITIGLVDRSQAHAREVFRSAIRHNAHRVLLAHNHPSGDPTPSANDRKMTDELIQAGKILGIEVVDHIIIGRLLPGASRWYCSFREMDLMPNA